MRFNLQSNNLLPSAAVTWLPYAIFFCHFPPLFVLLHGDGKGYHWLISPQGRKREPICEGSVPERDRSLVYRLISPYLGSIPAYTSARGDRLAPAGGLRWHKSEGRREVGKKYKSRRGGGPWNENHMSAHNMPKRWESWRCLECVYDRRLCESRGWDTGTLPAGDR